MLTEVPFQVDLSEEELLKRVKEALKRYRVLRKQQVLEMKIYD